MSRNDKYSIKTHFVKLCAPAAARSAISDVGSFETVSSIRICECAVCVGARKRTVNFCACLRCRTFIFYTWGIHCGPSQRHTCLAFHSPKCEEHLCTEWYTHAVTHQFKFKVNTHTITHSALLCLLCRSKPNNYFINGKTKTETVSVCSNRNT